MTLKTIISQLSPILNLLKKYLGPLVGTKAAGFYILFFAASIGIATFIENDFGTSSAQKVVYKSWWFELLLILFSITLVVNIVKYRMVQNGKWSIILFHISIIVIFIGAGVTRYFGSEGMMHIREGADSNIILSSESYLQFEVLTNNGKFEFDEPVMFATLGNNGWKEEYIIDNKMLEIQVKDFIPNPVQILEESPDGKATLKVVFGGASGREEYFISQGQSLRFNNVLFNFTDTFDPQAVNINYYDQSLLIKSNRTLIQRIMATQEVDTLYPQEQAYPLRLRSLYNDGVNSFVFGDFSAKSKIAVSSESRKVKNESMTALDIEIKFNGEMKNSLVFGKKGLPGKSTTYKFNNALIAVRYGSKPIQLPFKIELYDFIMERYPGTNSAASYASEVRLIDSRKNYEQDYRIYMNNILDYDGYRFFQSSFDRDEKGSYLSVNHDFWGTWLSYLGYFLLTVGMIWTLFSKKSRFYQVGQKIKKIRANPKLTLPIIILVLQSCALFSQESHEPLPSVVTAPHADLFSKLVIQDHKGRMKPMHTLSRELMRKIARTESLFSLSADQIILSMFGNKQEWVSVPILKLGKNSEIPQLLSIDRPYGAYKDFFKLNGEYKLQEEVRKAYRKAAIDRGTFDKELLKLDERVNIVSMIFSGELLKLIPVPNDPNNIWLSNHSSNHGTSKQKNTVTEKFFSAYQSSLFKAIHNHDYRLPDQLIQELSKYQKKHGNEVIPSTLRIHTEIFLNNLNVFNRLSLFYFIIGMGFLGLLITSVFHQSKFADKLFVMLSILVMCGFAFHTLGLGLRWYVSGRAPWSNGYESMIYIGWTTTLAGLLFTRKSSGGLAATMILAGSILLVAMLSYLDPEITPLVPVLRSYWLTIHVSLIAGSYGFLMLGAIIGLINLVLMILVNNKNISHIKHQIKELSYISEITITAGLIMISIGTYLGGVWANESWGRYWGWDAKETWALVTILVYAFILHMRLIPGIKGIYSYNLATLFGMASVMMTYFGVNYYLSGLHSYAAGDPVPIPNWVYIAVSIVALVGIAAYVKKRKYNLS